MKKTLLAALTAFTLVTSIFYLASCGAEDLCATTECGPHGKCNPDSGTCDCDAGYKKDTNGRCDLLIDLCSTVDCGANATCDKGICSCTTGYEKDAAGKCTIATRDKFKGTFTVFDTCALSKTASYSVVVTNGTANTEVVVTNFWNEFKNAVKATVDGSKITIARQEPDKDKFFVVGSGTIKDKTIIWNYTISDETVTPAKNDACRSKWVKQ